jgi:hypothetical protein
MDSFIILRFYIVDLLCLCFKILCCLLCLSFKILCCLLCFSFKILCCLLCFSFKILCCLLCLSFKILCCLLCLSFKILCCLLCYALKLDVSQVAFFLCLRFSISYCWFLNLCLELMWLSVSLLTLYIPEMLMR